jgi:hypothetical protein
MDNVQNCDSYINMPSSQTYYLTLKYTALILVSAICKEIPNNSHNMR